ncbi:MAG: hypothetical protein NXI30_24700 [bacterium]|nr:hypothetical protein [bacterium]
MTGSILRRASARMLVAGLVVTSSTFLFACGEGGSGGEPERVATMVGQAPAAQERRSGGSAPEIDDLSWSPRAPMPGRTIEAEASVSDADGDRTTVTYRWLAADGREIGEGRRFRTTGLESGDTIELVAVATDGENESEPWSVEIELGEQAAAIDLVAIDAPDEARPGAILEAVVETTDESQPFDILYTWRVGNEVVGEDDELDTSDIAPGLPIVLSARLEFDDRVTRPVHSRPFTLSGGGSPRIASEPPSSLEGGLFRYQLRVADAAADVRYVLAEGPDGMTVDAQSGVVVWRPGRDQRGRFDIEVQALDRWGSGAAQTFSITVDDPAPPASAR